MVKLKNSGQNPVEDITTKVSKNENTESNPIVFNSTYVEFKGLLLAFLWNDIRLQINNASANLRLAFFLF